VKLFTFAVLTGFQVINALPANYGFFVYLALALQVFLLTDRDLGWVGQRLARWRASRPAGPSPAPALPRLRAYAARLAVIVFAGISLCDALLAFAPLPPDLGRLLGSLAVVYRPWRVVNTYHLFGHITETRVEPEFEVEVNGTWQELTLRYKPGDLLRAPPFVAPHQPRVDFQLWFYGLSFQRGTPPYVQALVERLCRDAAAVAGLFTVAPPAAPEAVRIQFWRYRFSPPDEPVAWWTRELVATTRSIDCRA
jgi:hypothetical protein